MMLLIVSGQSIGQVSSPRTISPKLVSAIVMHGADFVGERVTVFGYLALVTEFNGTSNYYLTPFKELDNGSAYDSTRFIALKLDLLVEHKPIDGMKECRGELVSARGWVSGGRAGYTLSLKDDGDSISSHASSIIKSCY